MTARCLAMLVLALGLVLMHHTVIAAPSSTATTSVEHGHSVAPGPSHAVPVDGHRDDHHGGHQGAMMLHLCLAVLAALGVLLLVALHARRRPVPDDRDVDAPARAVPAPERPPPVPLRLARLQVLRL